MESVSAPPGMNTETPRCLAEAKEEASDTVRKGPPHVTGYPAMDTGPPMSPGSIEASDTVRKGPPHITGYSIEASDTVRKGPPHVTGYSIEASDTVRKGPPHVTGYPAMDTGPPMSPGSIEASHTDSLQHPFHTHQLLSHLPALSCQSGAPDSRLRGDQDTQESASQCPPCPLHIAIGKGQAHIVSRASDSDLQAASSRGLFLTDTDSGELFSLFQHEGGTLAGGSTGTPLATSENLTQNGDQPGTGTLQRGRPETRLSPEPSVPQTPSSLAEAEISDQQRPLQENNQETLTQFPHYPAMAKVPGPCEPEDLLGGVIFGARYLGSTQLECEMHQVASTRMRQAQEAVERVKAPEGESQPMTEVDVMVSTQRIKILNADTQEALMDHPLQTISYTADIGSIVVIMAHRKLPRNSNKSSSHKKPHRIICHVFQSVDAQLIAQAIGQAFAFAYHNFLHTEGLEPEQIEKTQSTELYNADLAHFTKQDNCKEVVIQKHQGEVLGVTIVESGWGSLLPTVVIANIMHGGPAERSGELSIGDHVISVNGTSLVGLPFSTCQGLIRELKGQSEVILNIVHCPPVVTAIVHRPNTTCQLGFCVEDGVICSLVRGGIAEKGGIRVGHRIIEINGQSVVATSHEKIIRTLLDATGEVHIKTMPASTYRLLTGQETPTYL